MPLIQVQQRFADDPQFRAALLADPRAVLAALGVPVPDPPEVRWRHLAPLVQRVAV